MKTKLCRLSALTLSLFLLTSCQQVKTRMAIREGNDAYAKEEWSNALKHYTRARQLDPKRFPELDRLIGYSYIGMYLPDEKSPENDKNASMAVGELRKYLRKRPNDTIAREALINLYLNSNRTTDAITFFQEYLKTHPGDVDAVRSVATLYAKQGNFNESLNWYEKITLLDAKNAEAFYIYGVVCWEKVAKNPPADINERLAIIEKGRSALTKAMNLRPDYLEAIAYQNLLYRQQALIEIDPVKQQALIAQADALRGQAMEINKRRKAAQSKS
jgi:tetratricopeptide (TPR) repeat protein